MYIYIIMYMYKSIFPTMAHVRWYYEMIWHHKTSWGDFLWVNNLAFHSRVWQATGSCARIIRSCCCCIPEVRWTEGVGAAVQDRLVSQVWQLMSHPYLGVQLLVGITREITFISWDISPTTRVLNPLIGWTAPPSISLMNIDNVYVAELSHL